MNVCNDELAACIYCGWPKTHEDKRPNSTDSAVSLPVSVCAFCNKSPGMSEADTFLSVMLSTQSIAHEDVLRFSKDVQDVGRIYITENDAEFARPYINDKGGFPHGLAKMLISRAIKRNSSTDSMAIDAVNACARWKRYAVYTIPFFMTGAMCAVFLDALPHRILAALFAFVCAAVGVKMMNLYNAKAASAAPHPTPGTPSDTPPAGGRHSGPSWKYPNG